MKNKKVTKSLMESIATYMDDEIREKIHYKFAPCSHEEFLVEYYKELEEDSKQNFKDLLFREFGIDFDDL